MKIRSPFSQYTLSDFAYISCRLVKVSLLRFCFGLFLENTSLVLFRLFLGRRLFKILVPSEMLEFCLDLHSLVSQMLFSGRLCWQNFRIWLHKISHHTLNLAKNCRQGSCLWAVFAARFLMLSGSNDKTGRGHKDERVRYTVLWS